MELMLTHLCPHLKPEYKGDAVPDAALRRIEEMASINIRRGDVYKMLCLEELIDPERIKRAKVNFWMAEKLAKLYVRNADNQLLSSKVTQPTAGSREPRSRKDQVRKKMLKRWFLTLLEKCLKHIFAVTDKNMGHIGGTEETFSNTYVQMCLWHAQRAVELWIQLLDAPICPYDAAAAHAVHDFIDETWISENLLQRCREETSESLRGKGGTFWLQSGLKLARKAEMD
ncbi:hypothetical protein R1sor_019011 [Riccia sorocarpa]|uniref:Uncharacterized protein n=1 Tax=Riccia sorocarpa TaxID=122646 RepID=A0ABD3ID22_9MARC